MVGFNNCDIKDIWTIDFLPDRASWGDPSDLKREFWINPKCKKMRLWDKSKKLQRSGSGIDVSHIMMFQSQHLEKGDFGINKSQL